MASYLKYLTEEEWDRYLYLRKIQNCDKTDEEFEEWKRIQKNFGTPESRIKRNSRFRTLAEKWMLEDKILGVGKKSDKDRRVEISNP